jgi:acyl CoA:acetate/3-ketoacid CoA transferase
MVGKVTSARDAIEIIRSGDTIASNGHAGCGTPAERLWALGERFVATDELVQVMNVAREEYLFFRVSPSTSL